MNQKTWLLLILLVLGGAAVWIMYNRGEKTTLTGQHSNFAVEDTASITKIFLADKNNKSVTLERNGKKWTVDGNDARPDVIKNMLYTLKNLTVRAPVPKSAFETVVKKLSSNSVKVEIYQSEEKPSKVFYVGGSNQKKTGTYMLLENSSVPFLMHLEGHYGFLESRFTTNPYHWRSNLLFGYSKQRLKEIEVIQPEDSSSSFRVVMNEEKIPVLYPLQGKEPVTNVDTTALVNYTLLYRKVHFEGYEETKKQAYLDSLLSNSRPQEIYRVTDVDGNVQSIATYKKPIEDGLDLEQNEIEFDLDRMYGLINGEQIVIIQYYTFDPLNRKLSDFKTVK